MHDHAPRRSTTLPGRSNRAEENRLRRHFQVGSWANDQRIVAAEFHDRLAEPAMNRFRHVQAHRDRAGGGDQRNPAVIGQFLANGFAVADQQTEYRGVGAGFTTNTFSNFCYCNRGQRSFLGRFPNCRIAADRCERRVPGPHRDRKIKCRDHSNESERMPLLHQTMVRPFGLDRQTVKHA